MFCVCFKCISKYNMVLKLLVLLFTVIEAYGSRYCAICDNHTLCKYPLAGPTAACAGFDRDSTLTAEDIAQIVNRINSRRNLVALGRLQQFPQAANMRRVLWSTELAIFAQRWADQCHPSIRPNKEDECRDLVGMKVGQNIATVMGPAPGLNVKSFVDMWFMLKLRYTGSVVYYNKSRDDKTRYFSQLIWADTEYVGCGRVKFFNREINTVIERLVCNFAPKGNNQGKPVYTLGFPATQCPKFMLPDREFTGLCEQGLENVTEIHLDSSTSLLKKLDSLNNSTNQDSYANKSKLTKLNTSENIDLKLPEIRGAPKNNNGGIKRDSLHIQNSQNNDQFHVSVALERRHSRMYHGDVTIKGRDQNFFPHKDYQRFHATTVATPISIQINHSDYSARRVNDKMKGFMHDDYGVVANQYKYILDGQRVSMCTRKPKSPDSYSHSPVHNQCTRSISHLSTNFIKQQELCHHDSCSMSPASTISHRRNDCPCKNHNHCPPLNNCEFPIKYPSCSNHDQPTMCAKRKVNGYTQNTQELIKNTPFHYYDLLPNVGLQSGDANRDKLDFEDGIQHTPKDFVFNGRGSHALLDVLYSSKRKRRDIEDQITFKPFWQMDEYNQRKPPEFKSLRYTTLADNRNRKTRSSSRSPRIPTESITIKLDDEIYGEPQTGHVTEKYLSFEELMRLRKLNPIDTLDYEARRRGYENFRRVPGTTKKAAATTTTKLITTTKKPTTTTTKKTVATTKAVTTTKASVSTTKATKAPDPTSITTGGTLYTTNTPFIRMKHCTRKITCTWTALIMATDIHGNTLKDVQGVVVGAEVSRTPPGYVEGCTRTSTCTRDFMDRNKMAETTEQPADISSLGDLEEGDIGGDANEDYCEKRSLDIKSRNSKDIQENNHEYFEEMLTDINASISEDNIRIVLNSDVTDTPTLMQKYSECSCDDSSSRVKRNKNFEYENIVINECVDSVDKENKQNLREDILPNIILQSISTSNVKVHKCACNGARSHLSTSSWLLSDKKSVLLLISFMKIF